MTSTVQSATADPATVADRAAFSAALTDLRLKAGMSIRALARTTGIPSATLGGYFSGRHLPPATGTQMLFAVLAALGVDDPQAQEQWRQALVRVRRGGAEEPGDAAGAPGGEAAPSPYRGLEPFAEKDADLFFGRDDIADHLVAAVDRAVADSDAPALLVLVGPSGSGKSSVLRAGLVPRLRRLDWAVSVMVPGTDPVAALRAATAQTGDRSRAVIVVDQAEELFSPGTDAEQRRAFLQALAHHTVGRAADRTVVAVLGLRADFYGQAAREPDLLPSLRSSQILLGPMTADELRLAVVRPAEAVGVRVDPELVDLLLRDVAPHDVDPGSYDAGALPLVSHALLSSWQRHSGDRLAVGDYVAAGGIAGAVKQTAEGVVADLDDAGRAAAQWLFTQLVNVSDAGVMTRRRVRPDELQHPDKATDFALDEVIEKFVAGRLLTADEHWLEISHEALLTAWPRLREWVASDLDTARLQRRITDAAAVWRERDRDRGALLRGGPLADAQALAAQTPSSPRVLTRADQEFVQASVAQADAEQAERRRRTARLRTLLAATTALAVVAGLLAAVALVSRGAATSARDEALSRQLAITADELRETDPALGAQLALAAYDVSPTVQARSALLSSTGVVTPTRFVGPGGDMHATASPDGTLLAVSGVDGVTRLWKATVAGEGESAYEPAGELPAVGEGQALYASQFHPDGRVLAVGGLSGDVVLWDVGDPGAPEQIDVLNVGTTVRSLAFTDDGSQLVAGTAEPAVQRWAIPADPTAAPTPLTPVTQDLADVYSVDFQPGTSVLATGTGDGRIRLWRASQQGEPALLGEKAVGPETDFVYSVAFSPDGRTLASGDKARAARLWDVTDPESLEPVGRPLKGFTSWVNSVAFSPDGTSLAVGSSDTKIKVFDVADGQTLAEVPGSSAVTSAEFVGDGASLLSSEISGTARMWPLPGPTLGGFADSVWSLAENADGTELAVGPGQADSAVHLFTVSEGDRTDPGPVVAPPARSGGADGAMDMSVDGQWIAAGSPVGKLTVWWRPPDGSGEPEQVGVVTVSDLLVEATRFSPDGSLVAAVADDGAVGVFALEPGKRPRPAHRLKVPGLPLGVAFSPDSSLLAVGTTDGQVHLWRLDGEGSKELPVLTGFDNYVYGLAFDPSGQYLAAGSTDKTVRIWDITDPAAAEPVGEPLRGPGDTLYSLSWNGDTNRLAGATQDGRVWLWDVQDPAAPDLQATLGVEESLYSVLLRRDGQHVSAGGAGAEVTTWETDPDAVAESTCARTGTPMTEEEWGQLVPGVAYDPPCG